MLLVVCSFISAALVYYLMREQPESVVLEPVKVLVETIDPLPEKAPVRIPVYETVVVHESEIEDVEEPEELFDEVVSDEIPPASPLVLLNYDVGKYTPMGAELNGNKDGSIPPWMGRFYGLPEGLDYQGSGDVYPDPYAEEKPLFSIDANNFSEYAERLSYGQEALFHKYPDYKMHVYPSHRDFRIDDRLVQKTHWNAEHTELVDSDDDLRNYTGGIPFPFPESGAEVIWNAKVADFNPAMVGQLDDIAVYANGETTHFRQKYVAEYPYNYLQNEIGETDEKIGIHQALIHTTMVFPKRKAGEMSMMRIPLNEFRSERKIWVYTPGTHRVRRAPTVGYDTPYGPGGIVTHDDTGGFNGPLDRYDWVLKGKAEIYIPYHSYQFDMPARD